MMLQSPYLEAIQAVPGSTPGQKFKELNLIARQIAENSKAHGDSAAVDKILQVPEALQPLVRVEIANVLQQPESIVEALKSEDKEVVERALRINWFFRVENKDVVSIEYFKTKILPFVPLNTRVKLVKRLAVNLKFSKDTKLAEEFYHYIARMYGTKNAEPLLIACGEDFIFETIKSNKIVLSYRCVKRLFIRYPELIIRYLRLSKPTEETPTGHKIDLFAYSDFLPRLIKKHLNAFIGLVEMYDSWLGLKLSNKAAETFLKNNIEALLNKPKLYTKIMPIKVITAKLTKAQFKSMFVKLYPKKWQHFGYHSINAYLEYYPEQERMSLIIDAYREAYNANLVDNHAAIGVQLLCMLPAEERARQARIKLEEEPDWRSHRYEPLKAWRCYLPIEESIPSIKTEISKSSSVDDRLCLLSQIIYTCKVNEDKEALIEVLRYITTRHKNEPIYVVYEVLDRLSQYFDLYTLSKDHWTVLNDFMKFLNVKDQLKVNTTIAVKIIAASIYHDLVNDLPIEEKIAMLIKLKMDSWNPSWSTLEKFPEYDRRCFDAMLNMLPSKYPTDSSIWKDRRYDIIQTIITSMYEFNTRNAKAINRIEKLSIRSYPWLCEMAEEIIKSDSEETRWQVKSIATTLKKHERDLYKLWFPGKDDSELNPETLKNSAQAIARLEKNPQNILDNWEGYMKKVKSMWMFRSAQKFFKISRWHQTLPIKFAEKCLQEVADNGDDFDSSSLLLLGILLEGSVFARVIEPFVPKDSSIDIEDEKAKELYRVVSMIPKAININNPPVSLSLVLSFCDGEYLDLGLKSLTNVCRRIRLDKVKAFTKTLIDRRVSVRKHGVRLFCLVASIEDLKIFLTDLWKTETHRSIRAVVFKKIYDLFVTEPSLDTWTLMKHCIADLKIDDDDCVDSLVNVTAIPVDYVAEYVTQLLETLESLEANGFSGTRIAGFIGRVIKSINESLINLLPEEFNRQLIKWYFFNPAYEREINVAATNFVLHSYLRPDKPGLESRLSFFCALYEDILRTRWDVPHPKHATVFPINYLSHHFIDSLAFSWTNNANKMVVLDAILNSYLKVLKPEQDLESYALLIFSIALKDAKTAMQVADRIEEQLPHFIETISAEIVVEIAGVIKRLIRDRIDLDHESDEMYRVIETLCIARDVHSCIIAAKLLFCGESSDFDERHNNIVDALRQTNHPAIVSLVYQHVNTCNFKY